MSESSETLHVREQVLTAVPYPRTDGKGWGVTCPVHFTYSPTDRERSSAQAFAAALACGRRAGGA